MGKSITLLLFLLLIAILFIGCASNTAQGISNKLPGIMVPVPDEATDIQCFMTFEPRLVIQYSIKVPEDSYTILDLYHNKVTEQGWESLETNKRQFATIAGNKGKGLYYEWMSQDKQYSMLFVMKTVNLPTEDNRQEYEVNINLYPTALVRVPER